jgi:hypothetical protein
VHAVCAHPGTEINMKAAAAEHRGGPQHIEADHCILWVPDLRDSTVIFQTDNKAVVSALHGLYLFLNCEAC